MRDVLGARTVVYVANRDVHLFLTFRMKILLYFDFHYSFHTGFTDSVLDTFI
jgi:hypothetical protein